MGGLSMIRKSVTRRSVLKGTAALGVGALASRFPMPAIAQETTWTLANSLRSLANPYHATFAKGGEDFAKTIGAKYETLVTEGNTEKGISDIKALLQRTDGKVKLLDFQPADWNEQKAFDITQAWLTRFGDQIKGVFAANDGMGMGALEALRQNGLAGKVPVTGIDGIAEAVKAIEDGEFAGTVAWDPLWTGGMGLAIPYAVATGKLDIAKEPHAHREFYGTGTLVTKATVGDYKNNPPKVDFKDF